jgi:hypothetical protein
MNGSQSYDSFTGGQDKEAIVSYTWYVRPQGDEWDTQEQIGTEAVFEHVFDEPGDYVVNLTVTDKAGLTGWIEKILPISGPDLQVNSITFDKDLTELQQNDKVKIIISYTNVGTVEVNGTWTLKILFHNKTIAEKEIVGKIGAGETRYENHSFKLNRHGQKTFEVILDINGDVAEMNEDNNELETQVDIKEPNPIIEWWMVVIAIAVIIAGYVVYMKYTRNEWGYEPIQRWWEKRNA